jgi:membrane protein
VVALAFLALVSLTASTALSFLHTPDMAFFRFLNWCLSISLFTLVFAFIYKYLPDVKVSWRQSLLSGVVTALLFTLGKSLIGLYLGTSAIGSAYGAAGSLIVLLVWVYYSSIVVFIGAELTRSSTQKRPPSDLAGA